MKRVLVVEDNDAVCSALHILFELNGISAVFTHSPQEALKAVREEAFAVVLQDMNFSPCTTSGDEGVQLFRALRKQDPFLPVLLMTAWSSLERAVEMVKEGAHDYIHKPWDDEKLISEVKALLEMGGKHTSGHPGSPAADLCGMVCSDPKTRQLVETALHIATADVPVLITGPNGAGKEMLAHVIQANSPRRNHPFIKVNVGALPDSLLESELFGAEAGAFTGAHHRRIGRFEEAHRGTLFLDEIGNMGLPGQMKVLRVLQSGEFSRLGHNRTLFSDTRIISATNVDLEEAIASGTFREDLYFRLNVVELHLPGLYDRPDDILPLTRHFLKTIPQAAGKQLTHEARKALLAHTWPGNIRELRNRLHRACLISHRFHLTPADLGFDLSAGPHTPSRCDGSESERFAIENALRMANGNVARASRSLGLSRQAMYRRMARHDIIWEKRPLA